METKPKGQNWARKKIAVCAFAGSLVLGSLCLVACSPQASTQAPAAGSQGPAITVEGGTAGSAEGYEYMDMPDALYSYDDVLLDWSINDDLDDLAPVVTTLDDGTQIQKVPSDFGNRFAQPASRAEGAEVHNIEGFNNLMFDADNRGCTTGCHSLEEAMANATWYHFSNFLIGYDNEQTVQTCLGCHNQEHEVGSVPFKDAIHTLHYSNAMFDSMDGDCQSCHYIDWDGEYKLWDEVKYDLYTGITDVANEEANASFDWNQTEITQREDLWFKTTRLSQDEMPTDETVSEDDFDNWVIKVDGDIDNPFEMTLSEMIETFGTETNVFATACHETGTGAGTVGQIEAEGIPVSAIIDYAQPQDGADAFIINGDDTYANTWGPSLEGVLEHDGMLVVGMNGDTIYPEQGYPVRFMSESISAGNSIKRVQEIHIVDTSKGDYLISETYGVFKPLMGVLSAYDGQIFDAGETVHLEGYAYAYDEPIVKVEFSFDGGATWVEYDTPNTEAGPWVYWSLDLEDEFTEKGAYLVKMKSTSLQADGSEREAPEVVNYLYNVR